MKVTATLLIATGMVVFGSNLSAANVKYGGMSSSDGTWGMGDLTVSGNSDYLRSLGAGIYIHELSWTRSTPAVRAIIPTIHTGAPVWESAMSTAQLTADHAIASINTYVVPNWPSGAWCLAIDGATDSTTEFTRLRNGTFGHVNRIAPIASPNSNQYQTDPWSSARWNQLRANCIQGQAYCTDTPPVFYLSQPVGYRTWNVNAVIWANSQANVASLVMMHPRNSTDFLQDTISTVNDFITKGANADWWICTSYYGANMDGSLPADAINHPIGNEDGPANNVLRAAHYVIDHY